jgi:type I restriction enzyme M protein
MATGTNTVVLFLRRRNNYDYTKLKDWVNRFFDNFQDVNPVSPFNTIEKPVSKYVSYVWEKLSFDDYITLLKKEPNDVVTSHEIYKEYHKKIKAKTTKDFWNTLIENEKEKLLYFILTYLQKVVLVKTGEKDAEKRFLGYEFSNRRGSEGIHPVQRGKTIDECTRLFDSAVFDNPEKASTYIYKAFAGDYETPVHESLQNNISRARLVDMLAFDRADFAKNISPAAQKKVKIESRWDSGYLEKIARIIRGVTYPKSSQTPNKTNKIILTADNITLDGKLEIKKQVYLYDDFVIPEEKKLGANDIFICFSSGSREHLGKVAFIAEDTNYYAGGFMAIIRVERENDPQYVYLLLNTLLRQTVRNMGSGSNINNLSSVINHVKIPLPPLEIQRKIVAEIEVLEKKESDVKIKIETMKTQVFSLLQGFPPINVSELGRVSDEKFDAQNNPDKEFLYLGLEHIESHTGLYTDNFVSGHTLLSVKNVFRKGDVLYGKLRPYLNKVVVAEMDGICSTDILVVKTDFPKILKYALLSEDFVKQTSGMMKGVSLPRISIRDFLNQKISVPPLPEQQKITAEIERIEARIAEARGELDVMPERKNAVLQKYL